MKDLTTLIIMDGYGIGNQGSATNAVEKAKTPNLDALFAQYPHTCLL